MAAAKTHSPQTKRFRTGHVIEEFSVRLNTILCVCAWKGDADSEWSQHKLEMKHTIVDREKWSEKIKGRKQIPF